MSNSIRKIFTMSLAVFMVAMLTPTVVHASVSGNISKTLHYVRAGNTKMALRTQKKIPLIAADNFEIKNDEAKAFKKEAVSYMGFNGLYFADLDNDQDPEGLCLIQTGESDSDFAGRWVVLDYINGRVRKIGSFNGSAMLSVYPSKHGVLCSYIKTLSDYNHCMYTFKLARIVNGKLSVKTLFRKKFDSGLEIKNYPDLYYGESWE